MPSSDFERRMPNGWIRWSPGLHMAAVQSVRKLGIFQLSVCKREPWENIWSVDLYKFVGYTEFEADGVGQAEQLALCWAYGIMEKAWEETSAAFRAQNRDE